MLSEFLTFINKNKLFKTGDKILLTVSGGIDSVVMSELFYQAKTLLQIDFVLAHCNFGLRGNESDGDELFVKKLAERYVVPFYAKRFAPQLAAAKEQGISTQMAARKLRYEWFRALLQEEKLDYIATAHQQNDVLETLLMNLVRGTGLAGLHGIPIKSGAIVRPLLFASKEEIKRFAQENQIEWREDSSNKENTYRRNLVRNQVIPLLKKMNPNLEKTTEQSIKKLRAAETILNELLSAWRKEALLEEDSIILIHIDSLKQISEPTFLLFDLLKGYGFSYLQSQEIIEALDKTSGKIFESPTHILVKDRKELLITEKEKSELENSITEIVFGQEKLEHEFLKLSFTKIEKSPEFIIPDKKHLACFDLEGLKFPLIVRKWKAGDFFYPLGMNQKKKISDFLIDLKVPLNLKEKIFVLVSGEDIVWVIGYRLDNRFKIKENTKFIFKIEQLF